MEGSLPGTGMHTLSDDSLKRRLCHLKNYPEACSAQGLELDLTQDTGVSVKTCRFSISGVSCTIKSSMHIPRQLLAQESSPLNTFPGGWARLKQNCQNKFFLTASSELGLSSQDETYHFKVITSLHLCSFLLWP